MNVLKGSSVLTHQETIHIDKVTTGSLVHAKTATISVVTAGAIVIAETITGLERITAGAIVIARYPNNPEKQNITIENGGRLYSTIEDCISDLTQDAENAESESKTQRIRNKIEQIDQFQMW